MVMYLRGISTYEQLSEGKQGERENNDYNRFLSLTLPLGNYTN